MVGKQKFLTRNGKKIKAFESPGITDAGIMTSSDLFNVGKSTAGLSTAPGVKAVRDIGTAEGRKLTKRSRKRGTRI